MGFKRAMAGHGLRRLSAYLRADTVMNTRSLLALPTLLAGLAVPLLLQGPALAQAAPAPQAQVNQIDRRVGTLESQMRAVQRQVFPGGDRRFFAPEIVPEAPPPAQATGAPASAPLADLTQRVTALETQQRQLTGQVEQLQFQMRQLETAMQKLRNDADFRLDALEGKAPGAGAAGAAGAAGSPVADPVRTGLAPPAAARSVAVPAVASGAPAAAPQTAVAPGPARPAPAGAAAVEAEYLRGYELYTAGSHEAAATVLSEFAKANPGHSRASNALFWAGRAMMAQGQTAEAAKVFLSGYQRYPRGERAHNSLLWLGRSLLQMNQPQAACQALDQLRTAYPDRLTGRFAAEASATRAQARCGA